MPVPSTIADLSATASSNYPQGSESPSTLDDYIRSHGSFIATLRDATPYTPSGTGAVATDVQTVLRDSSFSVKRYGAVGDGSDETTNLQNALNAAVGKTLYLEAGKTYGITSVTIPAGVTLVSNGATFRKIAASSTAGIIVQGGFHADLLSLSTPGSSTDLGIRFTGGNNNVDRIVCTSDAADSQYGVHFQSTNGTALENNHIGAIQVSNFKSAVLIFYIGLSSFNNIDIQTYITGVYLRDVYITNFNGAYIRLTSPSATGSAGQNGLLVENTLGTATTNNLRFSNWSVANAAEHSYRFGGGYTIQDVWLTNCRSTLSGNGGATATGGSGFKVLGSTISTGQRHRDFFFDNCIVEDVSTTGNGINNFSGFHMGVVDNLHISNCSVLPRNNTYSAKNGFLFLSVTDVFMTNNVAKGCAQNAILLSPETLPGYPGVLNNIERIKFVGGYYDVDSASTSPVFRSAFDSVGTAGTISEISMTGTVLSGGNCAVKADSSITYSKNYFDVEYVNPGNVSGAPPLQMPSGLIRVNYRGLYYGTYSPEAENGSYYLDTTDGKMRMKTASGWIVISDLSYGTWVPTVTAVTNLDSASLVQVGNYFRLGNMVTVSGTVLLDATAAGSVAARITPPIASAFTNFANCAGVASSSDGTFDGIVSADTATGSLTITCNASVTSARNVTFQATYRIL